MYIFIFYIYFMLEMALSMCRSEQKNKSGTCEQVQVRIFDHQ